MTNEEFNYPIGAEIVGYRYGAAPECGYSWNYAENKQECGVSMASVGLLPESRGFATMEAKEGRKIYYYAGKIAGTGGDDEICLMDCQKITKAQYLKHRDKGVSQEVLDIWAGRKAWAWAYMLENDLHTYRIPMPDRMERYQSELVRLEKIYGRYVIDKIISMINLPTR